MGIANDEGRLLLSGYQLGVRSRNPRTGSTGDRGPWDGACATGRYVPGKEMQPACQVVDRGRHNKQSSGYSVTQMYYCTTVMGMALVLTECIVSSVSLRCKDLISPISTAKTCLQGRSSLVGWTCWKGKSRT
jgi:hypothetical protein